MPERGKYNQLVVTSSAIKLIGQTDSFHTDEELATLSNDL